MRVCLRERRYADLGYLLPCSIGPAVKTRCIGPSSTHATASFSLARYREDDYSPDGGAGFMKQSGYAWICLPAYDFMTGWPTVCHVEPPVL